MDETAQIKKLEEKLKPLPEYKGRYPKPIVAEREQVKKRIKKFRQLKQLKDGTIIEVRNMDAFMRAFLKNGGNATDAAREVSDSRSPTVLASIGTRYLRKARHMGRIVLERKGWTYMQLIKLMTDKMQNSDSTGWWDRAMKIGGYENFLPGKEASNETNVVNIIQTEKSLLDKYISGEDEEDLIEVQEVEETEKAKR